MRMTIHQKPRSPLLVHAAFGVSEVASLARHFPRPWLKCPRRQHHLISTYECSRCHLRSDFGAEVVSYPGAFSNRPGLITCPTQLPNKLKRRLLMPLILQHLPVVGLRMTLPPKLARLASLSISDHERLRILNRSELGAQPIQPFYVSSRTINEPRKPSWRSDNCASHDL